MTQRRGAGGGSINSCMALRNLESNMVQGAWKKEKGEMKGNRQMEITEACFSTALVFAGCKSFPLQTSLFVYSFRQFIGRREQ